MVCFSVAGIAYLAARPDLVRHVVAMVDRKSASNAVMLAALLLAGFMPDGCDRIPIPNPFPPVPTPTPNPTPGPSPTPPNPSPVVDRGAWVLILEESDSRTEAVAKFSGSELSEGLAGRGLNYRIYDDDADEAKDLVAIAKSVPWVIIVDRNGKPLSDFSFPATVQELDAKIKQVTGL